MKGERTGCSEQCSHIYNCAKFQVCKGCATLFASFDLLSHLLRTPLRSLRKGGGATRLQEGGVSRCWTLARQETGRGFIAAMRTALLCLARSRRRFFAPFTV